MRVSRTLRTSRPRRQSESSGSTLGRSRAPVFDERHAARSSRALMPGLWARGPRQASITSKREPKRDSLSSATRPPINVNNGLTHERRRPRAKCRPVEKGRTCEANSSGHLHRLARLLRRGCSDGRANICGRNATGVACAFSAGDGSFTTHHEKVCDLGRARGSSRRLPGMGQGDAPNISFNLGQAPCGRRARRGRTCAEW